MNTVYNRVVDILTGLFVEKYEDIDDAGMNCTTGGKVKLKATAYVDSNIIKVIGYSVKTKENSNGEVIPEVSHTRANSWFYSGIVTDVNTETKKALVHLDYYSVSKGLPGDCSIESVIGATPTGRKYSGSIVFELNYEDTAKFNGVYITKNQSTGLFESGVYSLVSIK